MCNHFVPHSIPSGRTDKEEGASAPAHDASACAHKNTAPLATAMISIFHAMVGYCNSATGTDQLLLRVGAKFWEGDTAKQKMEKSGSHTKKGRHSMDEGFGKEFYGTDNFLKRSGPFSESPDSKNKHILCSSPSQISAPGGRAIGGVCRAK